MSNLVPTLAEPVEYSGTRSRELGLSTCLLHTLGWQVVAIIGLICHIILVTSLGVLAFPLWIAFVVVLFIRLPLAGYTVFLQVLLYQNWLISIFSPIIDGGSFQILQGTSFVIAAALSAVSIARILFGDNEHPQLRSLVIWVLLALGVVAAYTALGAVRSSPTSAVVYFRNTAAALLAVLAGLDLGRYYGCRTLAYGMLVSVLLGICTVLFEIADPIAFYRAIHAPEFMRLKFPDSAFYPFYGAADVLDLQARSFFNIGGHEGPQVSRIGGPNMHAISYGYVLAAAAIAALSVRSYGCVGLALAMLVFAGVKGALIMLLATLLLSMIWALTRSVRVVIVSFAGFCILYVSVGIIYGLSHGDYHVVGFLGGLQGFIGNPFGHGIGVGGNLSMAKGANFDWSEAQTWGATFGLESAIGVLLYQMGIGGVVVIWVYFQILRRGWWQQNARSGTPRSSDVFFAAMAVVLVNGIFQEEAFSPYALGLMATFCGVATTQALQRLETDSWDSESKRRSGWRLVNPRQTYGSQDGRSLVDMPRPMMALFRPSTTLAIGMLTVGLLLQVSPATAEEEYQISPGDTLEIAVFGSDSMRQRTTVGVDGKADFPLVGRLPAAGLTLSEIRAKVAAGIGRRVLRVRSNGTETEIIITPDEVSLSVAEYRPIYVNGDVSKPGEQAFRPGLTVRQAIALAGGFDIMGFRSSNPHFEVADLRSESQTLMSEYSSVAASIARLEAELSGSIEINFAPIKDLPVSRSKLDEIERLERETMQLRGADLEKELRSLKASIEITEHRLSLLSEQRSNEEEERKLMAEDLLRTQGLLERGAAPITRVNEARRALLLTSTQLLQTSAEIARLERDREDLGRKLAQMVDNRRMHLIEQLREANMKADILRSRTRAAEEKLTFGGLRSSLIRGAGSAPEVRITREVQGNQSRHTVDEDFRLMPGDVVEVIFNIPSIQRTTAVE